MFITPFQLTDIGQNFHNIMEFQLYHVNVHQLTGVNNSNEQKKAT
jgi:hypothetical protein